MRLFYLVIIVGVLFSAQTAFASIYDSFIITYTLRVGSRGVEVGCLQGKIGMYADGKFGPLTKIAVTNFQSRNGLVADGVVGPMTRVALYGNIVNNNIWPMGCAPNMKYNPMTGVLCQANSNFSAAPATEKVNPGPGANTDSKKDKVSTKEDAKVKTNLTNLDKFIDTVVKVQKKKGADEEELKVIAGTLREEVLSSGRDYEKEFKEMLEKEAEFGFDARPPLNLLGKILARARSVLGITPSVAQAAASGVDFGGFLIFPFYCAASSNWIITLTPQPPTYVVLLSYTPFTQGFGSYNIPYTKQLLGAYVTGGICSYGYVNITTEGTITSYTGSSPV